MSGEKRSTTVPTTRRSSRGGWLVVVVGVLLFRAFLTRDEYVVCSPSNSQLIYTVDAKHPRAQCISIRAGHIADVGNESDIRRTWLSPFGLNVRYTEPGQIIVPGFADAHAHLLQQGYKMQLELDGAQSVDEVVERIKSYILQHPDVHANTSRWIEGLGWDQTKWPGAQFPTAADLSKDPLLRGRPILLQRVDVHASWVSERQVALMSPLPHDVEGGKIIRDADGNPTGIFVDNAMTLIPQPAWTPQQYTDFFNTAVAEALKYGVTSVHDAFTDPAAVTFFKGVADAGKLPIRLYLMAAPFSENFTGWEPSRIEKLSDYGLHGRLNLRSVKLFTDGALGSWGAALLEPYSDRPDTRGIMRSSATTMDRLIRSAWKAEMQVNVHCIGDRANKVVLDVFESILAEEARAGNGDVSAFRPRIEHAQIMQPTDLERIGRLGVIPSVQPTHGTSDMWYAETRLGPQRIKGAYAYHTLLEASPNNIMPLGSDFPVEGVNPLLGFYAAVSRLDTAGNSPDGGGGWFPEQRLTREQALKGMTYDAAYASFSEDVLGTLQKGKRGDFVILDRNIMEVNLQDILRTKVVATVIDGEVAYGNLGRRRWWYSRP
ncbi:amidohydrolase family-domain-containing protein [Roridomyces roridus]|uniref:Amidohydrolase family-domain-containing protein n=1 Tax=Roridomyces roridus TaxID=1738132 RepID=A0AAD7CG26_9AGAR|nr:amidohydrolase family-domain-containing protein [Roridomyces roridus]